MGGMGRPWLSKLLIGGALMPRDMWIRRGGVGEDPWASWHIAEEDEADPADEEFFQEQAGYDEF
uniref:Uncharacterized protein n=1 Tax=Oryza sativa subsp. japonica TaxID=39947 RepID=Q6ZG37_ORYSJ|nr:hypothetical protein [Oryza sativa Japonica Group]